MPGRSYNGAMANWLTFSVGLVALAMTASAQGTAPAIPPKAGVGGGPREVLIIRTAEEPKGADVHLSAAGKARAKALADWIPATFGKPDALFASRATNKSQRTTETLGPIAAVLGLKIQDGFVSEDYKKLAEKLLKGPEFAGKRILICWTKGNIAALATALGARKTPEWPDEQYDHVWRLRFGAGGVTLDDMVQKLPSGGK